MAVKLNIKVIGTDVLARRFHSAAQRATQVMREKMWVALSGIEGQIKEKLSGKVLHVRTGRLRSSVTSRVEGMGKDIMGKVGTNVVYAPVHEYGAEIRPKKRRYLTFQVEGHWVNVKAVKIPRRPVWEPTLRENKDKIVALFRAAFRELLK